VRTSPIKEIHGEEKGKILKSFELEEETVPVDIVFVALGMIVYNELAIEAGASIDERGFVKTDETGHTNVPGLYVAGDLRANAKKQIYTAWDQAVSSCNSINQKLRQEKRPKL
jgi:thioredoxin reductase (NADPH)